MAGRARQEVTRAGAGSRARRGGLSPGRRGACAKDKKEIGKKGIGKRKKGKKKIGILVRDTRS